MNYSKLLTLTALALFSFIGCSDSIEPTISAEEPEPRLILNETSFDFGTSETVNLLTIRAGEADSISWAIISTRPWLSFDQTEGVAFASPDTIRMQVSREELEPGRQTARFYVVQLPDSQRTLISTTVEVVAPAPPLVTINDDSLEFMNGIAQRFIVLGNDGEGSYNWSLWPEVTSEWISISPTSGIVVMEPETLTVIIDTTELKAGIHAGILGVSTDAGNFSITVKATVGSMILHSNFNTLEEFQRNWSGDWIFEDSVLIGAPGDSIVLRPEFAPVVTNIRRIVVTSSMAGGIAVYPDDPHGIHTEYPSISIGGVETRWVGGARYGNRSNFSASLRPDGPWASVGPLELSTWVRRDYGEDTYVEGTVKLYWLEIWEK